MINILNNATMFNPAMIIAYNQKLILSPTQIDFNEYFKTIYASYYSKYNMKRVDYLLKLESNDNKFIVPHEKLIEFGVCGKTPNMTQLKFRMKTNNLQRDIDYTVVINEVKRPQGGFVEKHTYMLTSDAFKRVLLTSTHQINQSIDVMHYNEYYILLEKAYGYYIKYTNEYNKQKLKHKDLTIEELLLELNEQETAIRELVDENVEFKKTLNQILKENAAIPGMDIWV